MSLKADSNLAFVFKNYFNTSNTNSNNNFKSNSNNNRNRFLSIDILSSPDIQEQLPSPSNNYFFDSFSLENICDPYSNNKNSPGLKLQ